MASKQKYEIVLYINDEPHLKDQKTGAVRKINYRSGLAIELRDRYYRDVIARGGEIRVAGEQIIGEFFSNPGDGRSSPIPGIPGLE